MWQSAYSRKTIYLNDIKIGTPLKVCVWGSRLNCHEFQTDLHERN
jgi:hypothetical protein